MAEPLLIAQNSHTSCQLLPGLANRHGLITGATGTGKTVTLQKLAESFSDIGVPVFMTDIKGDLTGISQQGSIGARMAGVLQERGVALPTPMACPTTLWDVFGEQGHPVRTTISDMGPLLLSRMLDLNDTQSGVLNLVFKIADDNGLLQLETQGADQFFGEPMLNIADLMQTVGGKGVINILASDRLLHAPRLYGSFLLWLLSELFEQLPEIGDPEKPKLVFFFDEAHLLFDDAPKVLLERIELVVRLVRSKGVGVYFVTQNPIDVPDTVLAQLGNRVQHALRAFTPRDQKAVKATAETMRSNPDINIVEAITELGTGEALVSFLDEKGRPGITQRVFVVPPGSQIGPITPQQRQALMAHSLVAGNYDKTIDRESAYEMLQQHASPVAGGKPATAGKDAAADDEGMLGGMGTMVKEALFGRTGPRGGQYDGLVQSMAKSAVRSAGREIIRGVLGGILGRRR